MTTDQEMKDGLYLQFFLRTELEKREARRTKKGVAREIALLERFIAWVDRHAVRDVAESIEIEVPHG